MSRILSAFVTGLILLGAIAAQDYRPEPVSISKNVLKAYDRFHDRTTIMLKSFPVTATIGKEHFLLSMTTGFMFDSRMPSKRPESILLYFRETTWSTVSAAESLEDLRPMTAGEHLYLSGQSEVIALLDGERIKLPHGDEPTDFNGRTQSGQSTIIRVPLAEYKRMAQSEKLEILIGDMVVTPYMKKTSQRLVEMAVFAESIQVGKEIASH